MKMLYEADLDARGFLRGIRQVETYTDRGVAAVHRLTLALRSFERGNIGRGFEHLGGAVAQTASRFRDLGAHAFEAGRRISSALSGGLSILTKYLAIGTLVTSVLGGVATKLTVLDSAKFDSTIGRAALQAGAGPADRARLAAAARDIGVETPFGPQAVANTMKSGAQRGWDVEQILKMTDAVKRLAVVADMDLEQAGEVLSQVMFQFDVPMEKATETALKLANATVATSLAGSELFDALKFAGGAAGVFKVNLTELLAVLGTLRRVADASVASTSLRNIMLVATAIKAKDPKKLAELGLDEEDAKKLTFMTGEPKGIVDVVKHLKSVFAENPELVMKAGFGTRTLVALEQIAHTADKAGDFFGTLQARIDDVDEAQRQYNESIVLADNLFRRLEASAGAVMMAIGSRLREALGVDDQVGALGGRLAEMAKSIASIPTTNVSEIVDSLGGGLLQAFGVAVAFLVKSIAPVAITFGTLLVQGIAEALDQVGNPLDPHGAERASYVKQYRAMNQGQQLLESFRLAMMVGKTSVLDVSNSDTFMSGIAPHNLHRIEAMQKVLGARREGSSLIDSALSQIRENFSEATSALRANPTVQAVQRGLEASDQARRQESIDAARRLYAPANGAAAGFLNNGVVNVYGATSPAARAQPSGRPRASAAERSQR